MFYRLSLLITLAFLCIGFTACSSDQQQGDLLQVSLDKNIRNLTNGYYRRHYEIADTNLWESTLRKADTIVPQTDQGSQLKFRSEGIWYEAKMGPNGWRASQQYPGWEPVIDSIDRDLHLMTLGNRQYMQVTITAADLVLNGDSIRLGVVHPTQPAYAWNFQDYAPQPDYLILTTYGNDTFPISRQMDALGPISRQTVFRVGRHDYILGSVSADYDAVTIEPLQDNQGISYTAELDLSYRPVSVNNLDNTTTSIKRTPGKELILFFWFGFDLDERVRRIDSLYQALPAQKQEQLDIVLISHARMGADLQAWANQLGISLPMYTSNNKTCLRLNCVGRFPYFVSIDKRGRYTSFYTPWQALAERLEQLAEE
ncbi:MAG: hypothetical protein AAF840_04015 [Bacteroidota bacterium]